jgi:ribose-phosphate pyrophosphokinase
MYTDLGIFTGRSHPALAQSICDYLERPLGQSEVSEFSNENIFCRILENVRESDVFVVQPIVSPVNTRLVELLIMIDAFKRASAGRITAVVPYYAYGRSDKKDQPRVPITARLVANLLETAGASRVLTMDLHAGQIQGFFNIPVDELTALYIFGRYFQEKKLPVPVVVAPDLGAAKRARNFAQLIGASLALVEKRRLGNLDKTEVLHVIGDVRGMQAVIIDDEVDTAGTITETVQALLEQGVEEIYACASHPTLSGPAIDRLAASPLKELVVTDTVPVPEYKRIDKLTVLSVAPLLGEAIARIHTGQSVGELFQ